MALLQEIYHGLDPLTLNAIIEIQLEDSAALAGSAKGKQREGTVNDAEVALQVLTEDLHTCQRVLEDRKMARSMALAVHRDGSLISRAHQQEDQIARDRQLAASLLQAPADDDYHTTVRAPPQHQDEKMNDPWVSDELLEKAAALYNEDVILASPISVFEDDSDGNETTLQPESSAWGASRAGKAKQKLGHCVACGDIKDFFDVARVPCDHEYCRECLAGLFQASMKDESLFPPRCDGQAIPLNQVRFFLPVELAKEFEERSVELSAKNRVYCHDPRCSTFIPWSVSVERMEEWLTCPRCEKTTCTICKAAAHTGDCPDDTALQQLLDTAGNEQWQRCYQCHRFVELEQGCNHMTCPCGAHFCYICGVRWKTCPCPQWEEPRLYARAQQIIQREPNPRRRLFEPERAVRPQPRTRRSSLAAGNTFGLNAVPRSPSPESAWQSDFSDHSEWEQDWPANDDEDEDDIPEANGITSLPPASVTVLDSVPRPEPLAGLRDLLDLPRKAGSSTGKAMSINALMTHLRDNHECSHDKWRWVKGPHVCEECFHRLPSYIFECRQCMLQACNRCRRNRLSYAQSSLRDP